MIRTMKDSGVEWIGQIPKNWTLKRLQYILKERNELNSPIKTKNILSLTVQQGVVPYAQRAGGGNKAKEDLTAYKVVYKNDIVLNSMNVIAGAVNLSKYYGCVSPVYYMLYNDNPAVTKYYNLLFQTEVFQKSLFGLGNGILVKESSNGKLNTIRLRIPMDKLNKLPLPLPPLPEQQAIADYLDDKCAQIDNITATINEQIDVLKQYKKSVITEAVTKGLDPNAPMKDSGVEWIGQIPANWGIKKIKHLFKLRSEKNYEPLEEVNLISLYTELGVVQHSDLEETSGNKAVTADGYKKVYKNDIVVNIILCWMGAIGISAFDGVTSPAYDVYEAIDSSLVNPKYYHYLFRTPQFHGECYTKGRGIMAMRWRTYSSEFKNIKVVFPPFDMQQAIADYLDDKCAQIDAVIADKQAQLETLAAYKKSLIYEYVTGKKSVPGFEEA